MLCSSIAVLCSSKCLKCVRIRKESDDGIFLAERYDCSESIFSLKRREFTSALVTYGHSPQDIA